MLKQISWPRVGDGQEIGRRVPQVTGVGRWVAGGHQVMGCGWMGMVGVTSHGGGRRVGGHSRKLLAGAKSQGVAGRG